jgi:hypothetical protein
LGAVLVVAGATVSVTGFGDTPVRPAAIRVAAAKAAAIRVASGGAAGCRMVPGDPMALFAEPGVAAGGRAGGRLMGVTCEGTGAQGYIIR